jgi:ferredoxin-type protein NapG
MRNEKKPASNDLIGERSRKGENPVSFERRKFLIEAVRSAGIAAVGGLLWGGYVNNSKASPLILRPPAAVPEERFQAQCIKCGLCVEACPYHALVLAAPGDDRPIGTPYFLPRENPCRMCGHSVRRPTRAIGLARSRDADGAERPEISRARMGIMIDRETCIASWGSSAMPVTGSVASDKAITLSYARNDRIGKHALMAGA